MKTLKSDFRHGFTLFELLVVITILGILASLLFPAAVSIMRQAENHHAETTALNLQNAVSSYFVDYNKLPVISSSIDPNGDTTLESEDVLMNILCAAPSSSEPGGLNPKRTVYFADRPARKLQGGLYRKGVHIDADGNTSLWDPWGNHYFVQFDTDFDHRNVKPTWDQSISSSVILNRTLVWSPGRDKDVNAGKDNPKTW